MRPILAATLGAASAAIVLALAACDRLGTAAAIVPTTSAALSVAAPSGQGRQPAAAAVLSGAPETTAAVLQRPVAAQHRAAVPQAPVAVGSRFAGRSREVVNPDNATMVLLYQDLAGLKPPMEEWVEKDGRVQFAAPPEKAARREAVRAELEAASAAVQGIGRIRLSIDNAGLSDYDPANGEFTVQALSPSSELGFAALGRKVVTRFANGDTVQFWAVPPAQAQAVRDRIRSRPVALDVVLRIIDVQPGPSGGAIVTHVESYALRASDGTTLARIP